MLCSTFGFLFKVVDAGSSLWSCNFHLIKPFHITQLQLQLELHYSSANLLYKPLCCFLRPAHNIKNLVLPFPEWANKSKVYFGKKYYFWRISHTWRLYGKLALRGRSLDSMYKRFLRKQSKLCKIKHPLQPWRTVFLAKREGRKKKKHTQFLNPIRKGNSIHLISRHTRDTRDHVSLCISWVTVHLERWKLQCSFNSNMLIPTYQETEWKLNNLQIIVNIKSSREKDAQQSPCEICDLLS